MNHPPRALNLIPFVCLVLRLKRSNYYSVTAFKQFDGEIVIKRTIFNPNVGKYETSFDYFRNLLTESEACLEVCQS